MSAGAKRRRDERLKKLEEEDNKKKMARKDAKMPNVMVSERRVKLASKYKVGEIPHPFTSREQYERAMQMPVGPEWNTSQIVRKHTKPEVITKSGRIIEPITLPKSAKKKAAATAKK
jgi:U3 small nucleolar RNA-associated protein 14